MNVLEQVEIDKPLLSRMSKLGCVVDAIAYRSASGDPEVCRSAIRQTFGTGGDGSVLASIEPRKLRPRRFFGDWLDFDTGQLIKRGSYRNDVGKELVDPTLAQLAMFSARSSGSSIPDAGNGGQFAYAFLSPPYSLRGDAATIQDTFDEFRMTILPEGDQSEILDWTTPKLASFSAYFEAGMEWWGIFLFTIFNPSRERLIVLSASTSD